MKKSKIIKKIVVAREPIYSKDGLLHEYSAYCSWKKMGGKVLPMYKPNRLIHGILYRFIFPHFHHNKHESRLRFMSGNSSYFKAFPDYISYEIIPLYWDCWPLYHNIVENFIRKANVKTVIFTSSQVADIFHNKFPNINILTITEGIDVDLYSEGKLLKERDIDIIEFGRQSNLISDNSFHMNVNYVHNIKGKRLFSNNKEFFRVLGNSKISIALPRCITNPELAGEIETLTQRYWENMLSRIVMVGKAPKELIDLIGYNPVIDIDFNNPVKQIEDIIVNIEDYQDLVNKNREIALKMASWDMRMKTIRDFLVKCGYTL